MKLLKGLLSSAVPTAAEMHCVSCQQRKLVIKTSFRTRVKFWELPLKEMGETNSECIYFCRLSDALCRDQQDGSVGQSAWHALCDKLSLGELWHTGLLTTR